MAQKTTEILDGKKHSKSAIFKIIHGCLGTIKAALVGVGSMPEFEHHKIPNMGAKVTAALLIMSFQQPFKG
ncbi:MAG: hypothetical protein ACREOR_12120 [Candidatus Binatia bacterium]